MRDIDETGAPVLLPVATAALRLRGSVGLGAVYYRAAYGRTALQADVVTLGGRHFVPVTDIESR